MVIDAVIQQRSISVDQLLELDPARAIGLDRQIQGLGGAGKNLPFQEGKNLIVLAELGVGGHYFRLKIVFLGGVSLGRRCRLAVGLANRRVQSRSVQRQVYAYAQ